MHVNGDLSCLAVRQAVLHVCGDILVQFALSFHYHPLNTGHDFLWSIKLKAICDLLLFSFKFNFRETGYRFARNDNNTCYETLPGSLCMCVVHLCVCAVAM